MQRPNRLYGDLSWIWPLLSPPADYVQEAPVYISWFQKLGVPDNGNILHLGSGGGSIDAHLKKRYSITGVDISEPMLHHSRVTNPECRYERGDIRNVRLHRTFDGVLIHDAISYMTTYDDLRSVFRTAASHLNPGGAFVCFPEQLQEEFVQDEIRPQKHSVNDLTVTTLEVRHDPDPKDCTFETTFVFLARRGKQLEVHVDTHVQGIHPLESFVTAARDEKLKVATVSFELEKTYKLLVGSRSEG